MSLRFFSDQCVPREITDTLTNQGCAVVLLRDALPVRTPDPTVIAQAQQLDAILVSLNGDFADIVAYPPAAYGGIIAIQLHNHPETIPSLMGRLCAFLAENPNQAFYRGMLVIVEPHRIRIRE
jgi:predicted nuclease of predicted toxin-antitoxin system